MSFHDDSMAQSANQLVLGEDDHDESFEQMKEKARRKNVSELRLLDDDASDGLRSS